MAEDDTGVLEDLSDALEKVFFYFSAKMHEKFTFT